MKSEQCQAVGYYQGCQFLVVNDRNEIVEDEALNNLLDEDFEEEVMAKVTCRENQLLASRDYASLLDKQKM